MPGTALNNNRRVFKPCRPERKHRLIATGMASFFDGADPDLRKLGPRTSCSQVICAPSGAPEFPTITGISVDDPIQARNAAENSAPKIATLQLLPILAVNLEQPIRPYPGRQRPSAADRNFQSTQNQRGGRVTLNARNLGLAGL